MQMKLVAVVVVVVVVVVNECGTLLRTSLGFLFLSVLFGTP